jgi:hypothetical protein
VTVTGLAWLIAGAALVDDPTPDVGCFSVFLAVFPLNSEDLGLDVVRGKDEEGFFGEIEREGGRESVFRLDRQDADTSAGNITLSRSSVEGCTDLAGDARVGASNRDLTESRYIERGGI